MFNLHIVIYNLVCNTCTFIYCLRDILNSLNSSLEFVTAKVVKHSSHLSQNVSHTNNKNNNIIIIIIT